MFIPAALWRGTPGALYQEQGGEAASTEHGPLHGRLLHQRDHVCLSSPLSAAPALHPFGKH